MQSVPSDPASASVASGFPIVWLRPPRECYRCVGENKEKFEVGIVKGDRRGRLPLFLKRNIMSQPFLKWAGGKRWLVGTHLDVFPKKFDTYIEPFLGSGAVYFAIKPKSAILADVNKELIDTYISIKDCCNDVVNLLKVHHSRHSKEYYYLLRDTNFTDPAQKAARFIYLNRTCWNGLYRVNKTGKFNVPIGTKNAVLMCDDDFEGVSNLLSNAVLKVQDFEETIMSCKHNDFLFIDPPYTANHNNNGFLKYNEKIFSWDDQIRLRSVIDIALSRGAKFILTNANHSSVVDLYKGFKMTVFSRASVIAGNASKRCKCDELLIRG